MRLRALFGAAAATLLGLPAATARNVITNALRPSTTAFSLTTFPRIGGQVLADEAWRTVAPSSGFTQVQPHYRFF